MIISHIVKRNLFLASKKNLYKVTSHNNGISLYLSVKRTMFTTRPITKAVNMNLIRTGISVNGNSTNVNLQNSTQLKNPQRHIPGKGYIAGNYEKDTTTSTGRELPKHEEAHVIIKDNETGFAVAVLSSCKDESKGFTKLADVNYKNQILQNGQPKEQWMRSFDYPRQEDGTFIENKAATDFVNKHSDKVDALLHKTEVHKGIPSKRVNKNSSELFHENGQPIFDSNGDEIDYS